MRLAIVLLVLLAGLPARADFNAAREAVLRGEVAAALPELESLARDGLAEAQALLGDIYSRGDGVARDDAAAARWYEMAARQGYADAQYALGLLYQTGRGVPLDKRKAYMWMYAAFETGSVRMWWEQAEYIRNSMTEAEVAAAEAQARAIIAAYPRRN
jgi:TPR repeat protein